MKGNYSTYSSCAATVRMNRHANILIITRWAAMMIYLKCHTVSVLRSQANRHGAEAAGVFHPAVNVRRSTLPLCVIQNAPRVIFAFIMIGGKKEVRSSLRVTRCIISPRGGDPGCFLPACTVRVHAAHAFGDCFLSPAVSVLRVEAAYGLVSSFNQMYKP